jgi:hypothetical protein
MNKVQLGTELTRGLGCGGNPELGQKAAMESEDAIRKMLQVRVCLCALCLCSCVRAYVSSLNLSGLEASQACLNRTPPLNHRTHTYSHI